MKHPRRLLRPSAVCRWISPFLTTTTWLIAFRTHLSAAVKLTPCIPASRTSGTYQQATEGLTVTRTVLLDLAAAINNTKNAQKQACSVAFEIAGRPDGAIEYLRSMLDSIAYPFEHAKQILSLRKFILGDGLPEKTDLQGLIKAATKPAVGWTVCTSRSSASLR